jgi:chemotaxis protein CheX
MASPTSPPALPGVLLLPEVMDLKASSGLCAELAARRGQDILLNAAAVRRLGGQCLQVLLAARTAWREDRRSFQIVEPSDSLLQSFELFGVPAEDGQHKDPRS